MKNLKIVLWMLPIILLAKVILSYTNQSKTYASYLSEVKQSGGIEKAAGLYVEQLQKSNPDKQVNFEKMKDDLGSCMD